MSLSARTRLVRDPRCDVSHPKSSKPSTHRGSVPDAFKLDVGSVVLEGESSAAFLMLRDELAMAFGPIGAAGIVLIDHAAVLMWRLRRVSTFEAALLSWIRHQQAQRHDTSGVQLGQVFVSSDARAIDPERPTSTKSHSWQRQSTGRALEVVLGRLDPLSKIGRYEAHLLRQLNRTIAELRQLQAIAESARSVSPSDRQVP